MEWQQTCESYFEGELGAEQTAEFRKRLREDGDARREFVRHAALQWGLQNELKGRSVRAVLAKENFSAAAEEKNARMPRWMKWAGVAAVVMMLAYGAYRRAAPDAALLVFSAKIERVSGPVFVTDKDGAMRRPAVVNNYVAARAGIEFDGPGQIVLKCLDGTTADFTAASTPSLLRLNRADDKPQINPATIGKRLTVENGVLAIDAAPQPSGEPLIISTPQAEISVVGTRFKLTVSADQTRVEVSEGKVRAARYADKASKDVAAGESLTVSASGALVVEKK